MPEVREPLLESEASEMSASDDAVDALAYTLSPSFTQESFSNFRKYVQQRMTDLEVNAHPSARELMAAQEQHQRAAIVVDSQEAVNAVNALKLRYTDEVTAEVELRMIALGQTHLPGPDQTPFQYLEHLFFMARGSIPRNSTVRAPERSEETVSTYSPWRAEPPFRYEPRDPGFWSDAMLPAPPPPRDAGLAEIQRVMQDAAQSRHAPAREEPKPPQPVEIRVSPPTGKRHIDLDEE